MKTFRIALLLIMFLLNSCQDFFKDRDIYVQTFSSGINNVRDVFFINESIGYGVGLDGIIQKTINGGQTWASQESGTPLDLTTVFFLNEKLGFVTGAYTKCPEDDCYKSGSLLKTTDGGKNWINELKPNIALFYDLFFFDENNGIGIFLTMNSETVAATTNDGGNTWNYLDLKISNIFFANNHSIERIFVKNNICFLLGGFESIYKSSDLGKNWEMIYVPIDIKKAYFVSAELAFISDNMSTYKTINGGKNWKKLYEPDFSVNFFHFFDEFNGFDIQFKSEYLGGDFPQAVSSIIYVTSDGGTSWNSKEYPDVISGYKSFPTNRMGFCVNDQKTFQIRLK